MHLQHMNRYVCTYIIFCIEHGWHPRNQPAPTGDTQPVLLHPVAPAPAPSTDVEKVRIKLLMVHIIHYRQEPDLGFLWTFLRKIGGCIAYTLGAGGCNEKYFVAPGCMGAGGCHLVAPAAGVNHALILYMCRQLCLSCGSHQMYISTYIHDIII